MVACDVGTELRSDQLSCSCVPHPQSSLNHDECMRTFSDAGIYVIIDLGLPLNGSINRADPSWDIGLQSLYIDTLDAFMGYDNLLAVGVGNEVVTLNSNTNAAPFVKAAARDTKAYLASKDKSNILVTYSGADAPSGSDGRRKLLADFLTCGSEEVSLDLYGHNSYAWCGSSSLDNSGYATLADDFASLPVPAYFSEFGCVQSDPADRTWGEVAALFAPPMTESFSGGSAFTFFPKDPAAEGKDYGLTTLSADGTPIPSAGFDRLKAAYAAVSPPTSAGNAAAPAYPECDVSSDDFQASTTLPPTPDVDLCNCYVSNAFSCIARGSKTPAVLGVLQGQACGYIIQQGGDCSELITSGQTGTYGNVSFCSQTQRLNWAFSRFYELTNRNEQSCDFAGNATINRLSTPQGSSTPTMLDAMASCRSENPIGTSVPESADSVNTQTRAGSGSSGATDSSSGNDNGVRATASSSSLAVLIAVAMTASVAVCGGLSIL